MAHVDTTFSDGYMTQRASNAGGCSNRWVGKYVGQKKTNEAANKAAIVVAILSERREYNVVSGRNTKLYSSDWPYAITMSEKCFRISCPHCDKVGEGRHSNHSNQSHEQPQ